MKTIDRRTTLKIRIVGEESAEHWGLDWSSGNPGQIYEELMARVHKAGLDPATRDISLTTVKI